MLRYVDTKPEIRQSLHNFNRQAGDFKDFVRPIARQTQYWVYDPALRAFGPNKFVGFYGMTIPLYQQTLQKSYEDKDLFRQFHPVPARRAIERILGASYEPSAELSAVLEEWAESLLDISVFRRVNKSKWKFVCLDD